MTTRTPVGPTETVGTLAAVDSYDDWMSLAHIAYQRLADEFAAVPADRWAAPTPCDGWTVRDMAGHVVGAMRSAASLRETASQQRAIKRRVKQTGEPEVDAMTAVQIERTADLTTDELLAELQSLVPEAVAGRMRMPSFLRRRAGFRVELGTIHERWTLDYFLSTILTRDAWLHRVDLADALDSPLPLDAHDRAVVGDVAAEWCARHGRPVELTLTGAGGGTIGTGGTDRPSIELDALEFCRIVSGRKPAGHPLLEQAVPF